MQCDGQAATTPRDCKLTVGGHCLLCSLASAAVRVQTSLCRLHASLPPWCVWVSRQILSMPHHRRSIATSLMLTVLLSAVFYAGIAADARIDPAKALGLHVIRNSGGRVTDSIHQKLRKEREVNADHVAFLPFPGQHATSLLVRHL